MLELLKSHLRPGSPLALCLLLAVAVVWLYARAPARGARLLLLAMLAGYWMMATPLGAGLLASGLSHGLTRIESPGAGDGADAIVLLGGGARTFTVGGVVIGQLPRDSVLRALEAARLFKVIAARFVVASGGTPRPNVQLEPESTVLRDVLIKAGVPASRIIEENNSKTTLEQAIAIRPILTGHHARRFVLVTSSMHMRRALGTFRAQGLDPIPAIAPLTSERIAAPPFLLPNEESLTLSDGAMYEYAASVYYWWHGWTAATVRDDQPRHPTVSVRPVNPGPPAATYP